jgi:hypothetical protein
MQFRAIQLRKIMSYPSDRGCKSAYSTDENYVISARLGLTAPVFLKNETITKTEAF